MTFDFTQTKRIYDLLQDDYSRFLYEKRVMWSLTGSQAYADDILKSLVDHDSIDALMKKADSVKNRMVIRGVGNDYYVLKKLYPNLDCAMFVDYDKTKQGTLVDGKKVISPEAFYAEYRDYYVLINSTAANHEIKNELLENGITEDKILDLGACYESICDKQYFEEGIVPHCDDEVFIDGGCYDGRTIAQFVDWCGGKYKKIYSFEPDTQNYELVTRRLEKAKFENVILLNKGLWNETTTISFSNDGSQGSRITEEGGFTINTASIDEVVEGGPVTFIKLDVEGAEYKALEGARNSIKNYRPKMAISIYHKPEDIFELPELIMSIRDDYRFYLRHYQLSLNETILYCI